MAGEQTQDTHKENGLRQLVVFVRQKAPSTGLDGGLAAAESMVDKVTGAVEGAASAVEGAMASIPGLNMLIKEDKKESTSQDKYNYFENYSQWDKVIDQVEDGLTDMNENSAIIKYDYDAKDADGRKQNAQSLLSQIKSKVSSWRNYTSDIHFVGLADGGNISNECANLLASDGSFNADKWTIRSITYIGTPLYKEENKLDKDKVKNCKTTSFGNRYDLTQMAVGYFEPYNTLIQQIKDSNKGTLSLFIGKIKMHMVQALAVILKGASVGTSSNGQSPDQLYNGVKDEVEGLVKEIVASVKQLIEEGLGMIKPGDLPDFNNMIGGYDQIPSQVMGELKTGIDNFKKKLKDKGDKIVKDKKVDDGLGLSDLSEILNCLCPLFDTLTKSMRFFSYNEKGSKELSAQIIDACKIEKVYTPSADTPKWLDIDNDLIAGAAEAAKNQQPDLSATLLSQVKSLLTEATKRTNTVSDMNGDEKSKLAQAIFVMMTPMLPSKIDFYKKLINAIPFNLGELTKQITANEYLKKMTGPLEKIGIKTPPKLQKSVDDFDSEFKRITGYVNKNNYKTQEKADSMYLIHNSHNLMLSKCWGFIGSHIDKQTGIQKYKQDQGFANLPTVDENKYVKQGDAEIKNNIPTKKVEEEPANA